MDFIETSATKATGQSIPVRVEKEHPAQKILGGGSEGVVKLVTVRLGSGDTARDMRFAYKQFESPDDIDTHMRAYDVLSGMGFPVTPTFRRTPDGILMTDLSGNGTNLVLSYNDLSPKRFYAIAKRSPELVGVFDGLDLSRVPDDMASALGTASGHGVDFGNIDIWTFVMKPDGSHSFLATDLLNVGLHSAAGDLLDRNTRSFDLFRMMVSEFQHFGTTPRDMLQGLGRT